MKKIILVFLIIIYIILPVSCASQTIKTESKNKLTIEDIKSRYTGGKNGQIVNLTTYKDYYLLVEYTYDSYTKGFDFYNMKTGDKDTLYLGSINTKLEKIKNENSFIFITDGVINNGNGHKYFPQLIKYNRAVEISGYDGEFYKTSHKLYLGVDQGVDMGTKDYETIADIKVSLHGLGVLFEPMKGKEGLFYAAYTSISPTKTSYDKTNNQLIVEFKNTDVDSRINKSHIDQENRYLSSVDIEKNGLNTILKINLKDTAKYYNIEFSHLEANIDDYPYIEFDFAGEFSID